MNDLKEIIKLLEIQGKAISRIEKMIERQQNKKLQHIQTDQLHADAFAKKQTKLEPKDKSKPKYSLSKIYQKYFFKTEKSLKEVSKKLKDDGFNFKSGSIQFALDSAEYLNRKGEKGNYRWIQKYPPN